MFVCTRQGATQSRLSLSISLRLVRVLSEPVETLITVCPGSSDPQKKIFNIFVSENEVYTILLSLQYFRLNTIRLQSKIILGHMN